MNNSKFNAVSVSAKHAHRVVGTDKTYAAEKRKFNRRNRKRLNQVLREGWVDIDEAFEKKMGAVQKLSSRDIL